MLDFILAALAAAGLMVYWTACRKASLQHREKAAELIEQYYQSKATALEKESIYGIYMTARRWIFLPSIVLVAPIFIIVDAFRHKSPTRRTNSKEFDRIMDSVMSMYIARNPITGIVCLLTTIIMLLVTLPAAILINHTWSLSKVSLTDFYGSIASRAERTLTHKLG